MNRLKITDLQKKYWLRYIWWRIVDKRVLLLIAKAWKEYPIVAFPLTIDIEIGNMIYFYLLNGWNKTLVRCTTYNEVIAAHLKGEGRDDEHLYLQCLTKKAKFNAELNQEIDEIQSESAWIRRDKKTGRFVPHYHKVGYNN